MKEGEGILGGISDTQPSGRSRYSQGDQDVLRGIKMYSGGSSVTQEELVVLWVN